MMYLQKAALFSLLLVGTFSCTKDEVSVSYFDKLEGYYSGTTYQYDTLTNANDGSVFVMQYKTRMQVFIQKNQNDVPEIAYSTEIETYYNSTYMTGALKADGLIEGMDFTKENLFFINETRINFEVLPVTLKGNGTFDETTRNLVLNLVVNTNGKIRQIRLDLARHKRLGDKY